MMMREIVVSCEERATVKCLVTGVTVFQSLVCYILHPYGLASSRSSSSSNDNNHHHHNRGGGQKSRSLTQATIDVCSSDADRIAPDGFEWRPSASSSCRFFFPADEDVGSFQLLSRVESGGG